MPTQFARSTTPTSGGEQTRRAARIEALRDANVNLLAFSGFPQGATRRKSTS